MKKAAIGQLLLWLLLSSTIVIFIGTTIEQRSAQQKFLELKRLNDQMVQALAKHYLVNGNTCDAQTVSNDLMDNAQLGIRIGGSCSASYRWHPDVSSPEMVTATLQVPHYKTFWFKFLGVNELTLSNISSTASVNYSDAQLIQTDVSFESTDAGYHSIVGTYETYEEEGETLIRNAQIFMEDQHNYSGGDAIGSFTQDNTKLFIIANGAQESITVNSDVEMVFENGESTPTVYIDGQRVDDPVYFQDVGFNSDNTEHFQLIEDPSSGFDHYVLGIEDMPNGGDNDFNDVILKTQEIRVPPLIVDASAIPSGSQAATCSSSCF